MELESVPLVDGADVLSPFAAGDVAAADAPAVGFASLVDSLADVGTDYLNDVKDLAESLARE